MNLQEHLKSGEEYGFSYLRRPCSKIVCADGFQVSVQASTSHYCTPRDDYGPYSEVELGYPNEPVEAWMEYAEDPDRPTTTVYGYVPIEVVEVVLDQHGGIDWAATTKEEKNETGTQAD